MKRKILLCPLLVLAFLSNLFAQIDIPSAAPLSEEFVRFMAKQEQGLLKINSRGYVPHCIDYNRGRTQQLEKALFDPVYDLRSEGYITFVKNQGSCGSCWSFATMGSLESRWLKLGFGTYDLSENNLIYGHGFQSGA